MRFANPGILQLLWLIPVLFVVALAFEVQGRKRLAKAFGDKIAPYLTSSVSPGKRRLKLVLRLLALGFFILALARPQMGQSLQEITSRGVEIVVAFDVSNSMLAEDVKPSRLQHAKSELTRLLDLLSGDKVGLVAFAGSAALISPLTTDKSALKMFVDSLSASSVGSQGTNFQRALNEATSAFERGGVEGDETERVTRVVLVLSDGEDHEQGAVDQARELVSKGTRIFTVAFGTEAGGPVPLRDDRGFLRGYRQDRNGQNVISRVKGEFLRELAKVGQGSFYHATFGGEEMRLIHSDLERLEQAEFSSNVAMDYDEKFQFPLFFGLLIALAEMAIGERRAKGRIWKGRFEVSES